VVSPQAASPASPVANWGISKAAVWACAPEIEPYVNGREYRLSPVRIAGADPTAPAAVASLERIGGEQASAALARDARRYAEADRLEHQRLRQNGDPETLARFARDLPKARRIQIGREMAKDRDAAIAQAGAALLIEEGEPPPTAEVPSTQ